VAKRVLVYLTADERVSLFDNLVAIDGGVYVVLPCTGVSVSDVGGLVYDSVFARSPDDLKDLAFFVGGRSLSESALLFSAACDCISTLSEDFRVSVCTDPSGAFTTGSSVVCKVKSVLGSLDGVSVLVLAGTGPVGMATAGLFALEGANVGLSSRKLDSALNACSFIESEFGARVSPCEVEGGDSLSSALEGRSVLVSCGASGVRLVSKKVWSGFDGLRVLADINAVEPSGIEGVSADFDGVDVLGKTCFGALSLGDFKMRVHDELVRGLFSERGSFFGLEGVRLLAKKLI